MEPITGAAPGTFPRRISKLEPLKALLRPTNHIVQ
jgi:hypothetical protein